MTDLGRFIYLCLDGASFQLFDNYRCEEQLFMSQLVSHSVYDNCLSHFKFLLPCLMSPVMVLLDSLDMLYGKPIVRIFNAKIQFQSKKRQFQFS